MLRAQYLPTKSGGNGVVVVVVVVVLLEIIPHIVIVYMSKKGIK